MSGEIGGRAESSFDNFTVEIGDDQIFRIHFIVGDAAGFDDHQRIFAGDAAGVAEGIENQPVTNQLEIGFENFCTETREKHRWRPT